MGNVTLNITPEVPVLVSPNDNVTLYDNLVQEFIWDISDRAETYQIQIATDSNFNTIIVDEADLISTHLEHTFLAYTTYYWRVRATNSFGSSAWATYRTLILSNALDLTALGAWLKWNEGLTMDNNGTPTVRRWDSINGAPAWFGNVTKSLQPTIYGDGSIYFDNVDDYLQEQDDDNLISGDIFYSPNQGKPWTILHWTKIISNMAAYVGIMSMNGYPTAGERVYTEGVNAYMRSQVELNPGVDYFATDVGKYGFNEYGTWVFLISQWDGKQLRFMLYNKDKTKTRDGASFANDSIYVPYKGIKIMPNGRVSRHIIIFTRALSVLEIEKVFDMTIGDIP